MSDTPDPPRKKRGPKRTLKAGRTTTVFLENEMIVIAARIGNGVISDGVRIALMQYAEAHK